jgi:hypothetical protein
MELLLASMEILQQVLFREPDGRQKGLIFSFFSFVSLLGWVYLGVVLNGPHILLVLGIAFAFTGVAESLPSDRRRSAGVLRILSLGIVSLFVVLIVFAPELILD